MTYYENKVFIKSLEIFYRDNNLTAFKKLAVDALEDVRSRVSWDMAQDVIDLLKHPATTIKIKEYSEPYYFDVNICLDEHFRLKNPIYQSWIDDQDRRPSMAVENYAVKYGNFWFDYRATIIHHNFFVDLDPHYLLDPNFVKHYNKRNDWKITNMPEFMANYLILQ